MSIHVNEDYVQWATEEEQTLLGLELIHTPFDPLIYKKGVPRQTRTAVNTLNSLSQR